MSEIEWSIIVQSSPKNEGQWSLNYDFIHRLAWQLMGNEVWSISGDRTRFPIDRPAKPLIE